MARAASSRRFWRDRFNINRQDVVSKWRLADVETKALEAEAAALDLPIVEVVRLLCGSTCDIYLNYVAFWRNVPLAVWEYYIGG